jgi:hemolysin activation/secretion protein
MLSAAFVQPQEIADGIATIRVNEGSIHNVVFEGLEELDASSGGILSTVRQILLSAPLRQEVLEKTLLLLNDIQGVSATAIFKASPQVPGQVDMIIPIQRKSGEWRAALNNRGSRYVGPWQASVTGIYYGAINHFDTVVLQALSGTDNQELLGVLGQYEIPLNASGTTLNAKFNRAWSEPGYTLRSFQLESLNQGVSIGIHQSLKRTRDENLKLEGNIGARYSKTKFDGALFTEDDYRSAEVNIEYDFADAGGGITLFNFGVAQGLNILGEKESGKPLLTRRDGKSDFTKLTLYTSRSQSIVSDTSVFTAFSGQFAFSQLLSAEEFGYGGASFGRAYDASEFTGDHGLSALVELRQDADLQGSTVIQAAQLFAAYDFGATWNIDDEIKGPRRTGASASIGLRYTLFQHLNGSLEVAKPLTRPVGAFAEDSNKSPRFFAGFQVSF